MLDSDQRVSAAEALGHAYFSQYHDPDDEPEAEPYDDSMEAEDRSLEEWKGGLGRPGEAEPSPGGRALPVACFLKEVPGLQGGGGLVKMGFVCPVEARGSTGQALEGPWPRLPSKGDGPGWEPGTRRAGGAHLSHHPPELTYQEVLSFKPPEPPQPPVSLEIGQ